MRFTTSGRTIKWTSICFVEAGKPCQADVLQSRVQDPDEILTMPGKGKLLSLIEENEKALETFRIAESSNYAPGEWEKTAEHYQNEIELLKNREKILRVGLTWNDWSCVSGNCTAGGTCKDGVSMHLKPMAFKIDTNILSTTPRSENSGPRHFVTFIVSCTYSFAILIGMCLAAFANQLR